MKKIFIFIGLLAVAVVIGFKFLVYNINKELNKMSTPSTMEELKRSDTKQYEYLMEELKRSDPKQYNSIIEEIIRDQHKKNKGDK